MGFTARISSPRSPPPPATIPYASLTPLHVALDAEVSSREQLFARIGWMVHARRGPTPPEIALHLMKREQRSPTALGHGVALPHAHVPGLRRPVAAFVRPRTPIPMCAPDARPVSDVFALLVPKPGMAAHLELLARLARLLREREFREALGRCTRAHEVERLFEQRLGA
jgi:PTS system nitrogen regulatory IIA component